MGLKNVGKFILGGVMVAASFVIPGLGAIGASLLLTAGTGLLQAALAPSGAQGVEIDLQNTTDTQNPLPVVYGETVLPIRIVDVRVDPNSEDRKDLWIVGALCHGSESGTGIESIREIYFDNVLAVDATGTVQTFYAGKLECGKFLGTDAQNVATSTDVRQSTLSTTLKAVFSPDGVTGPWPNTSAGAGVACVVLRLTYDQQVYAGIPNVTCVVRGNKVYDPRTIYARSDGGFYSGWTWTANPVLCIADYLWSERYGLNFADAAGTNEVACGIAGSDATSVFSVLASFCEDLVDKPTDPVTQDWRFKCNGALDVSQAPTENLRRLLSSCRGALFWEAGQARIAIRDVVSLTEFTLDESVIVGDWNFRAPGVTDAPNVIDATFPDGSQNYRADSVRWPNPDQTNDYLTADNAFESVTAIDLPMTAERWRAEQIALVTLKEMRSSLPVQVTCRETALQLRVGDVVPITHSLPVWTAKPFWVTEIVFDPSTALVRLSLVAYDENAYDLDPQTEWASPPATNLPDPTSIAPPTGVTLLCDSTTSARMPDGSYVNRIKVSWTPPSDPFLNHYLFAAGEVGGTIAIYGPALAGDTYYYLGPVGADELWQVQMVSVNGLGRESTATATETVGTAVLNTERIRDNVLVNGDFQGSAVGVDATGWTLHQNAHLVVTSDDARYGDRAGKIDNGGTSQLSASYQSATAAGADEVWEAYGWCKVALGGAGEGAGLSLDCNVGGVYSPLTVLDSVGSYIDGGGSSGRCVYVPRTDPGSEWKFLRLIVQTTAAGTFRCMVRIGYATGCSGYALFDGLVFHQLAPATTIGGKKGDDAIDDDGGLWVPATEDVNYGTQGAGSYKTKKLRFAGAGLATVTEITSNADGHGMWQNGPAHAVLPTPLPIGIRIVNVRIRYYRLNSSNFVNDAYLYKRTDSTRSTVANLQAEMTGTGWNTATVSADSVVADGEHYHAYIDMTPSAINSSTCGVAYVELEYRTYQLAQTV